MRMTFYTANCRGNAKNNLYPNKRVVDNEDDSLEVMAFDHVCGEFKDFRRSGENFLSSDVEVMDCDNDHSDAPVGGGCGFLCRTEPKSYETEGREIRKTQVSCLFPA